MSHLVFNQSSDYNTRPGAPRLAQQRAKHSAHCGQEQRHNRAHKQGLVELGDLQCTSCIAAVLGFFTFFFFFKSILSISAF